MGLSNLGIFHTIIGIVAIVAAIVSYVRFGRINLASTSGKIYLYGTIVTSLTSLGLLKHGFNPGHGAALFILVLVLVAYYLHAKRPGNNSMRYFENFFLSFSFFLSWVPTVNETFNRVPIGHPFATQGPGDPLVVKTLLLLLVLFIAGSAYQFRQQRKINNSIQQTNKAG